MTVSGVNFNFGLVKKAPKDIMSTPQGTQNGLPNLAQALSGANKQTSPQQADATKMSTSELYKHVYQNEAGQNQVAQGGKQGDSNNTKAVILPATVEYNNQKFAANGQDVSKVANEISSKTGDSKLQVETELKKKYANPAFAKTGTALNMNA